MRSRANIGKSLDFPQELREQLFTEWKENEKTNRYFQSDIARMYGLDPANFHSAKKSKWWREMKKECSDE